MTTITRVSVNLSTGKTEYKTAEESFINTAPAKKRVLDLDKIGTAIPGSVVEI